MLALLFLVNAAGPLDVAGVWATSNGRAHVEILIDEATGPRGQIIWYASYGTEEDDAEGPVLGRTLLEDFTASDDKWRRGTIYNLKNGQAYRSALARDSEDTLSVEGCLAIFCRTQIWTRVPEDEIRRIAPEE